MGITVMVVIQRIKLVVHAIRHQEILTRHLTVPTQHLWIPTRHLEILTRHLTIPTQHQDAKIEPWTMVQNGMIHKGSHMIAIGTLMVTDAVSTATITVMVAIQRIKLVVHA